ncbi:ABC transporter permease [Oleiagrimonas soli]|nr:FtsX-like permease family protein [Oleiagrimonas soli]MBB6184111.1 putative ABC transport system permease protein [Oleiagrimonas soli]
MQLQPILASLKHHKLTALLLMLQVAFTCAIITNAVFLIAQRIQRVTTLSGLDENTLSLVNVDDLDAGANPLALHKADLAMLRRLDGVKSAALISNVPFSHSEHGSGGCTSLAAAQAAMKANSLKVPGCAGADVYVGTPGTFRTLGLKLVAGREFEAGDYVPGKPPGQAETVSAMIVTRDYARRLYPEHPDHVVGRDVYFGGGLMSGQPTRIVGVVAHLHKANVSDDGSDEQSALLPVEPNEGRALFALRSEPSQRSKVMEEAVATLNKNKPNRQISTDDAQTYTRMREDYFRGDTTMIRLLLASALGLLFVTALGIAGLASFWVQQRTRTIGIRRAIGASRGNILHYFQTENFLIVGAGAMLGMLLAIALNLWLMRHYELPRLPWFYLPVGALALCLLGQLAVLAPARRAARVPPVVATRSV